MLLKLQSRESCISPYQSIKCCLGAMLSRRYLETQKQSQIENTSTMKLQHTNAGQSFRKTYKTIQLVRPVLINTNTKLKLIKCKPPL